MKKVQKTLSMTSKLFFVFVFTLAFFNSNSAFSQSNDGLFIDKSTSNNAYEIFFKQEGSYSDYAVLRGLNKISAKPSTLKSLGKNQSSIQP